MDCEFVRRPVNLDRQQFRLLDTDEVADAPPRPVAVRVPAPPRESLELRICQVKALLGDSVRCHPEGPVLVQAFVADSFAGRQEEKGAKVETRDTLF